MLNGLFLGIRDTITPMQAYQIMSPIRPLKYVIVFPNSCTKLGLSSEHFFQPYLRKIFYKIFYLTIYTTTIIVIVRITIVVSLAYE